MKMVLITYGNSEGSGEPAWMRSLPRAFTVRSLWELEKKSDKELLNSFHCSLTLGAREKVRQRAAK